MFDHILSGTLPGWTPSDAFNWPALLLICLGLPLATWVVIHVLGSGRAWHREDPQEVTPEQEALALEAEIDADRRRALGELPVAVDTADIHDLERDLPDGPNAALAQRALPDPDEERPLVDEPTASVNQSDPYA